jgi:peptide/nickel transport system permease protein
VTHKVQKRMGVTIELTVMAAIVASAIAIPFGVISAAKRNSPLDYGLRFIGILALCIPSFWLATLVLVYGSIWFTWVPTSQKTSLFHDPAANLEQFIVPSLILGAVLAGGLMRITRSQMLEVLREDYIRTARSKGLRGRVVIVRHALRNALIPVVTVIGLQITGLLSGTVIVESIFGLQGLGTLITNSLDRRDYPVVQGVNVVAVMIVIVINLAVDMSYAFIDPRLRHAGS